MSFYNTFTSCKSDSFKTLSCLTLIYSELENLTPVLKLRIKKTILQLNNSLGTISLISYTKSFLKNILESLIENNHTNFLKVSRSVRRVIVFID